MIYRVFLFIAFLMICLVVTGFVPLFTDTGSGSWYDQLQKPFLSFPGSLFGSVSMLFSLLIAFSGWSIWHSQDTKERRVALLFWIVQFILYGIWNGLFFVLRQPGMALLEILLLWFAIGGFVIAAWKVRRLAAFSFFFYWVWMTFVTLLNLNIWWQN
ncbi:TspO/MBR family protein [Melghirimyces algeriensis]|uniref:TspO and MBR related proteins n=1 Tax=Melghirimyces algeriensis TaxID=910412 RepID=A0A521EK20_9BACL|nr:TspO/MBR family protein [Melghirimyces algeriensis]SMO84256.1 TspO and MBR related proteins [Melghirimyces algeriensis]